MKKKVILSEKKLINLIKNIVKRTPKSKSETESYVDYINNYYKLPLTAWIVPNDKSRIFIKDKNNKLLGIFFKKNNTLLVDEDTWNHFKRQTFITNVGIGSILSKLVKSQLKFERVYPIYDDEVMVELNKVEKLLKKL